MLTASDPAPSPDDLAEQYEAARLRITELLTDLDDGAARRTVPACPDWTVQQLAAHLAGVPADLVARRNPTGDTQAWVDAQVADRAGRTVAELLAEWADVAPAFEALIARHPAAFGSLTYDVVAHEHDLRATLGRPGARDSAGVLVATAVGMVILERDLAGHDLPAVRLGGGDHWWLVGEGAPGLALDTDLFELFRLLGSRRSEAQVRAAAWQGDVTPYLPVLGHMPLPAADLVE